MFRILQSRRGGLCFFNLEKGLGGGGGVVDRSIIYHKTTLRGIYYIIFILFLCSRNSGAGTPQFQALAGTQYSKNQEHRSFMAIIEQNNKTRKLEL